MIVEENSVISHGRVHRPVHPHLQPRNRRNQLRPRARRLRGGLGNLPKKTKDGKDYSMYAAIIVEDRGCQDPLHTPA